MAKMVDAYKMIADTLGMRETMGVNAIEIDGIVKYLQENAVEAEPTKGAKHSGWNAKETYDGVFCEYIYFCRLCGVRSNFKEDYCPNCGAVMDGGTWYDD